MPAADTTILLTGLAEMIAAAGLGITWNPDGVYTAGQTGIYMKVMPPAVDRALALTAVNQGDNITMPLGQVMVQAKFRGLPNRPLDVDDFADSVFSVLHGTKNLIFDTLTVVQLNRQVSVPNGQDDSKRWERIDQYYGDVSTAPTVLRPESGSW